MFARAFAKRVKPNGEEVKRTRHDPPVLRTDMEELGKLTCSHLLGLSENETAPSCIGDDGFLEQGVGSDHDIKTCGHQRGGQGELHEQLSWS